MADWTKLHLIDNIDYQEDAQGLTASARFRMLAADLAHRPVRGDSADPLDPTWQVDKVTLTAYTPHHYYVAVTARPRVSVGSSYHQPSLRGVFDLRLRRSEFLFSTPVMGVKPVPADNGQGTWEAADVTLDGTTGIAGYVPTQRNPTDPARLLDWAAAVSQVPAACPFTAIPAWRLHQQTSWCDEVSITFHVRANFLQRYLDFSGVNDGNGTGGIPTRYRLPGAATAGVWRALDQTMEAIQDATGRDFWRITRLLQRVPPATDNTGQPLRWDPAKHGGALRWTHT